MMVIAKLVEPYNGARPQKVWKFGFAFKLPNFRHAIYVFYSLHASNCLYVLNCNLLF